MGIASTRLARPCVLGLSFIALLSIGSCANVGPRDDPAAVRWSPAPEPAELRAPGAQWISVDTSSGHKLLAAVFRPQGAGPFPVVVVLHGAAGLRSPQVSLAEDLARAGLVAVAGCWQSIASPPAREPNPVCSAAPPQTLWQLDPAKHSGQELVAAARTLPGVRRDRVGLYGMSRGGHAALWAAATSGPVQAVVADAAAHHASQVKPTPPSTLTVVDRVAAPTLLLHGTADRAVPVAQSREYETAARKLGKPVTAVYFEGMGHQVTAPHAGKESPELADLRRKVEPDARRQAIDFLREHLTKP